MTHVMRIKISTQSPASFNVKSTHYSSLNEVSYGGPKAVSRGTRTKQRMFDARWVDNAQSLYVKDWVCRDSSQGRDCLS